MATVIEKVKFGGWEQNVRLTNGKIELVVTQEIGPRVIRLGFVGERNLFAEMQGQLGRRGEKQWMLRGGHRLWAAPEVKPDTYELDNGPVDIRRIEGGLKTVQPPGQITGIQKTMEIRLATNKNEVCVVHALTNRSRKAVTVAPWALSVMAPGGMAIIPLPEKIAHTERLTHNQQWSIWGYTNFADGRWTLGSNYVFFRQDRKRGPGKLGVAHREGWVAYQLGPYLFVKGFAWVDGATYPDAGMNIRFDDTAANGDIHYYQSVPGYNTSLYNGSSWAPDGRNVDPATMNGTESQTSLLDEFIGLSGNGSWTLFLADLSVGEETTVISWGIEITAVPEPSGLALFALGLLSTGGLMWFRHRKR